MGHTALTARARTSPRRYPGLPSRRIHPRFVSDSVLAPVRAPFRAVACAVVPEAEGLDGAGWSEVEGIVEQCYQKNCGGVES